MLAHRTCLATKLFGKETIISKQAWDYTCKLPDADLHFYAEAFLEGQDIALTLTVERATEREHKEVKGTKRCFSNPTPGTACARKRHKMVNDELTNNQDHSA